jgi:AbrB family looped-hinge helix DNA binding protein
VELIVDRSVKNQYNKLYKSYFKGEIEITYPKGKYAWMVTVGEKGQFVIPKQAREIFGIKPGDNLILLGDEKRGIAKP